MNLDFQIAADHLEQHGFAVSGYLRREPCFLTGSRAYGTPRYGSDVDMVVLMSEADISIMRQQLHWRNMRKVVSFHMGNLNLLTTSDCSVYQKWRDVTDELIARKPVTKVQAIAAFAAALGEPLADQDSVPDWDDS